MADRLGRKGNHAPGAAFVKSHMRHGSVDDNPSMIIQSTNDSRVEEILPTVTPQQQNSQHRQNTKSVQMRSTMYNNSYFQKLINNVQGTAAAGKNDD